MIRTLLFLVILSSIVATAFYFGWPYISDFITFTQTHSVVPPTLSAGTVTDTSIQAKWTGADANAVSFTLSWKSASESTYLHSQTIIAPTSSFVVTNLNPDTSYSFKITQTVGSVTSLDSVVFTQTTLSAQPPTLSIGSTTDTSIEVIWTGASPNAASFTLSWKLSSDGSYTNSQLISNPSTTRYTITGLIENTSYTFKLNQTIENDPVVGPDSTEISTSTLLGPVASLTVSSFTSTSISLNWAGVAPGIESFKLSWMSQNETNYPHFQTINNPTVTSYTVSGLIQNTTYYFKIVQSTNSATSADSSSVSQMTALGTISNVGASIISSTSIQIQWDSVPNATSYVVQYNAESSPSTIFTESSSSNVYTISNLTAATTYDIQVATVASQGTSGFSNILTITTAPSNLPAQVVNVISTAVSSTSISLSWDAVSATNPIYTVEQKLTPDSVWATLGTPNTSTTTTSSSLAPGTSYDFRVYASNSVGRGPYSNVLTVVTPVADAPATVSSQYPYWSRISLSWSALPNVTGYSIRYKLHSDSSFTATPVTSITNSTVLHNLPVKQTIDFQIAGTKNSTVGVYSSTYTVTLVDAPSYGNQLNFNVIYDNTSSTYFISWNYIAGVDDHNIWVVIPGYIDQLITPDPNMSTVNFAQRNLVGPTLAAGGVYTATVYTMIDNQKTTTTGSSTFCEDGSC